ncbi:hypothetical protein AAG906_036986 [Vitis piasezkii]
MTWFLQSTDLDLWDVIEDDPTFPSKLVYGVMVPKPKQEWDECDRRNFQLNAKVTAIQEAKDLTKLPLEELIGSLMTYEINLAKKQQEGEEKKKKSIALKATTKEEEEVDEEKQSEEDEHLALITRKFNKERWEEKRDLVCFKCKKPRHIKYDCPLYKSEAKKRKKKTMMATWSEKKVANMCFMAIDELDEFNNLKKYLEK